MSLALARDGHADSVEEEPVNRAGEASLGSPVPLGAAGISREGILR